MKLSAPIYKLKSQAKALSRQASIPLHAALDQIARDEGFANWSLLASQLSAQNPAGKLLSQLAQGELVLLGARPGHGKTLLGLELALNAVASGRQGWFFTLEWSTNEVLNRLPTIADYSNDITQHLQFDTTDAICGGYIISRLSAASRGSVVVIDYLQLLDQRRENPTLQTQVRELKSFARDKGIIVVMLSQIDRSYDAVNKPLPDLTDIRLPNPIELTLFDKMCFLNEGVVRVTSP